MANMLRLNSLPFFFFWFSFFVLVTTNQWGLFGMKMNVIGFTNFRCGLRFFGRKLLFAPTYMR